VYGLSILDDTYDADPESYYHDYRIVESGKPERVLEGLRLVFIELPKYRENAGFSWNHANRQFKLALMRQSRGLDMC